MNASTEKSVKKDLKINARGLGIPEGAADDFIACVIPAVKKSLAGKAVITDRDLDIALARELKKYNADFAYVYKNRDKII